LPITRTNCPDSHPAALTLLPLPLAPPAAQTGSNGAPLLTDAVAFMECRVQSRLETADHWLVYAEVTDGAVTNPDAKTASHHRKVANYY